VLRLLRSELYRLVRRLMPWIMLGLIVVTAFLFYFLIWASINAQLQAIKNGTIPNKVRGLFGAEHVMLKPATAGTGIVAGGAVRAVIELAGIHNIVAKTLGRGNLFNVVQATLEGLNRLRDPEEVLRIRRAAFEPVGGSGHG